MERTGGQYLKQREDTDNNSAIRKTHSINVVMQVRYLP
jgi:hypothetical protein